jgi:hypothetical protein
MGECYFDLLKKKGKTGAAEGFAIAPKRGENHEDPEQDGEIHG